MSYYCYSFDLKKINSINEYLFILKNCLRLISKKNLYSNNFNKRVHVGYCNIYKDYFYTENFSLQKILFSSNNNLIKNLNINNVLDKLKLNKHLNRRIEFEIDKDFNLYPISLYSKDRNKLILAYSDLYSYFNNIDIKIKSLNLQIKIKNYQSLYIDFKEHIKNKSIFGDNKLENYFFLNKKNTDIRLSYSCFDKIYKQNSTPLKKYQFYYIIFLLSIEFNNFLVSSLDLKENSLAIFDRSLGKIIKIPKEFYDKKYESEDKDILPPLMPVSF